MHSIFTLLLQVQAQTPEILTRFIAVAGFLIVIVAIIFIAFFIVNRQKRNRLYREQQEMKANFEKQLLRSQIEVQEATLSAVGMELHDNICQLISSAKVLIGYSTRNLDSPPQSLFSANETLSKALEETRILSKSLSKNWLEQFDLLGNLKTEVARLNNADGMRLHLKCEDEIKVSAEEGVMLFRIIQEAMQNSIKHAKAENIFINLEGNDDVLTVHIEDDGIGVDEKNLSTGLGTRNMQQRANLLGGKISWTSMEKGCKVSLFVPFKKQI